ncbi:L-lysine dehydrogenase [Paenibacillus ginsengarvi]|uniref:L-lysine dehydrogenase n=2 Tax=Paenibacillus ginsengarvi TaxID=400777 RepID=A0A3B0BE40_9BACL|nr:L-lysine dehydrogenase [Paenibacillus ginsengarvi]
MKVAVLGTGMVGYAVVRQLAKSRIVREVIAADADLERVEQRVLAIGCPNVTGKAVDLGDESSVTAVLAEADVAINCLPASLSLQTTRAAIAARCHLVDLSCAAYEDKLKLDAAAKGAGILVVPGCGVAPGLVGILAARGVELMDEAEEAILICGGLPRHPLPPLSYQIVFSVDSLFQLYRKMSLAAENGQLVQLPPFSGLESIRFDEPVGECEAVITDAWSLPHTLRHKVGRIYEKTVRYKGHWSKLATLAELGFMSDTPVEVGGVPVCPLELTKRLLEPQMKGGTDEDLTVARVTVSGKKGGRPYKAQWDMIDLYDSTRGITSMARTTGFPAVVMAEWIAEGRMPERGVLAPEQLVTGERFEPFVAALRDEGIRISYAGGER